MPDFNPHAYMIERLASLQLQIMAEFKRSSVIAALIQIFDALGETKFNDTYSGVVSYILRTTPPDSYSDFHGVVGESFHKSFRQQDIFGDVVRDGGNYDDDAIGYYLDSVIWNLIHASNDFWIVMEELSYISYELHLDPNMSIKRIVRDAEDFIYDKNNLDK